MTSRFFSRTFADTISSRPSVRFTNVFGGLPDDLLTVSTAIVGGLILLVNMGPGGLSVDEKKKTY
jgi:hypothetical protein